MVLSERIDTVGTCEVLIGNVLLKGRHDHLFDLCRRDARDRAKPSRVMIPVEKIVETIRNHPDLIKERQDIIDKAKQTAGPSPDAAD